MSRGHKSSINKAKRAGLRLMRIDPDPDVLASFHRLYRQTMLVFIKIFTVLEQSVLNGVIVKRRSRIGRNGTNSSHLNEITVFNNKINALLQCFLGFANISEDNVESRCHAAIARGDYPFFYLACRKAFLHEKPHQAGSRQ